MQIIGYVLLMLIQGSAVPVTEKIYTQQEYESRVNQIMAVRDVEIICGEVIREIHNWR
ncbi:hypothetical protein [Providencia sp. PROV182]|uniref:hypothetical protein n=1 Tax=Providencia sp. PROV182 TaxID=2949885 RepID=UPI002349E947|nr:hypothetical protein [Providencia sp. PROV182]